MADDIQFFGEIDRTDGYKGGEIKHTYPAWYFTNKTDELEQEIDGLRRVLENEDNLVGASRDAIPEMRRELRAKEDMYSRIMASKPTLTGKDKDSIAKVYGELGERIKDSMFSYTDMQRGTVSAHEEANRMKGPCIDVPHGAAMLMQKMGIPAGRGGKISRDQASRAYKILGRLLDANTNVEVLRRDVSGGSFKIHRSLEEMEKD